MNFIGVRYLIWCRNKSDNIFQNPELYKKAIRELNNVNLKKMDWLPPNRNVPISHFPRTRSTQWVMCAVGLFTLFISILLPFS